MNNLFDLYCNLPNYDDRSDYYNHVVEISKIAEEYRYKGTLFHFNLSQPDPFVLASLVIQNTKGLIPIVAVQPQYINPVAATKIITTLSQVTGRPVYINMIVGAAQNEALRLGDTLTYKEKYARLEEYISIFKQLFHSEKPIQYKGEYYHFNNLSLSPLNNNELLTPKLFVSGASDHHIQIANSHADVVLTHPQPVGKFKKNYSYNLSESVDVGIKIGIIARKTSEEAWKVANARYPVSKMAIATNRYKKHSESAWIRNMALEGIESELHDNVFWLGGYISGLSNNPILVGEHQEVRQYLKKYSEAGAKILLISGAQSKEDFENIDQVLNG
ncbi:alkanesulfonate monooxygenase SsuD/methylene tetrahydromethanopterin reductase-like flavin-dependent oxidoreductase (luciferase family) [Paenibacillus sp. JGP012]|uniref:LLM class flavin-dependent oxidoreductase n=1 Tax=Paenibacillus sp. JGP012 TaxID=2735914 RepID=UPI00161C603F|nr:LLM class flavin-dependent oxidoreductase [Paenibacillus sp. JGP012]MBB6022768.1 alkanesulfonate monooxygenase SsuD/methylene tetrahydromethanopterin reductase-like flavin-dependent oxidoreductase (luciferase family) [Paenibacillus sp. JGP012]